LHCIAHLRAIDHTRMHALAVILAGVAAQRAAALSASIKKAVPATPELCGKETYTCTMSRPLCDYVDVQGWTHAFLK
jgi:cephalosporin-C deacetylase-like acetyl esterase